MRFTTRLLERIALGIILTIFILLFTYNLGYDNSTLDNTVEPVETHFWIDNDRVPFDSEVYPSPIYDDSGKIIGSNVIVRSDKGDAFIEFLDSEDMTWKDDLDSWIAAYKEKTL